MAIEDKQYDIVIFGATGYTGQLVIEYFLTGGQADASTLKWAIAARNASKIEETKQMLKTKLAGVVSADTIDKVPVIVADGSDKDSVLALVRSTRVVLSVAGPYALYSALVVELCAENGVHYCDLTGEMTWARQNVIKHEAAAKNSGARLVHCCGYEAVPSDIMTFLLADYANTKLQTKLQRVNFFWTESMGTVSGGTVASLLNMLDTATPEEREGLSNPFFYTSSEYVEQKKSVVEANLSTYTTPYDADLGARSAWFIGGMINQHVVLRSNFLLNDHYGQEFSYLERMGLGQTLNWVASGIMGLVASLAVNDWTRKLLWKLAPSTGVGASDEKLKEGFFKAKAFAYGPNGALVVKGESSAVGDPGYLVTSKMISEVAFCLAKNEHEGAIAGGGFLTPASACGHSLASRLNSKSIVNFSVERA